MSDPASNLIPSDPRNELERKLARCYDLVGELRRYFVEGHEPATLSRESDLYLLLCEIEKTK
jgi:hypothetical protein